MDPRECMAKAANLLIDNLRIFADEDHLRAPEDFAPAVPQSTPAAGQHADMLIEELELGVRSYHCLKREGIETVGELIARTEAELLNIPNFGKKSIEKVRERLAERNLKLRGE